jgi:PAS domain S-box-containing protein
MLIASQLGRWALDPYTRDAVPLATMYVAVAFAVWFGGWKPAAALAVTGYFVGLWWFMPPRFTFKWWGEFGPLRTAIYTLSCAVTIYLCELMRRARTQHAAAEAKVVSIIENMREGFCSVDTDWRISAVNRSAEEYLGKPRGDLIGRKLWDVVPSAIGTPLEMELRRAMQDSASVHFETSVISSGLWHAVTATRTREELSIFFQDVTAKRAHVDQLERLVDDRTAALQRIVADLEAFSYTLVHDMRAPLRAISGFAELLAVDHSSQLDADGKRHLARIQRSAARMDQLIVDILSYSQLSRAHPELHAVNLDDAMRDILRSHSEFQADKADIEIESPLPTVRGNDALLTQCFSNLLHNATKFVAPGVRPKIRIASKITGDVARIEVVDNGIGIAPDATARIFEPFRREHAHYDGTGIGLAIVQKVVEQLEGRVGVISHVGEGSRFWVELKVPANSRAAAATHGTTHAR